MGKAKKAQDEGPTMTAADASIILKLYGLQLAIEQVRERLTAGTATDEQRESARMLIRTWYGIPDSPHDDNRRAAVLALNIGVWIQQARDSRETDPENSVPGSFDGHWLRRNCLALDVRFDKVPLKKFQQAIDPPPGRRGRKPWDGAGAELVVAAGLYTNPLTLRAEAAKLKCKSKKDGVWQVR